MSDVSDETIAQITGELAEGGDGVWIAPEFATEFDVSGADEANIEEAVAQSPTPVRVVLHDVDFEDARFDNTKALVAWVQDEVGGDTTYVLTGSAYDGHRLDVVSYGAEVDDAYVDLLVKHEHPDDPVEQVLRSIELLEDGNARELYTQIPTDERYESPDRDGDGDSGSGLLFGGGIVLLLGAAAAAWWLKRRRTTSGGAALKAAEPRFRLPDKVLRTVREAEDRQLRQRAERSVLDLGESLDRAEIRNRTPEGMAAWQAALDHYAAASRILDTSTSPADVMGALVLADRGRDAHCAAAERRPGGWQPAPTCYFHPLHTGEMSKVAWGAEGRQVTVTACETCAAAVSSGHEPEDVLDFIDGSGTVHYFHLDLEPWSTTGYGALDPDLLQALLRTGR